jgi:tRNA(Ile2)-agmatinylcytidine synthase
MYVAIDNTDSTDWMCTTFLATELIRSMGHYDLIGHPRLVRLNPAVPWKTRGNGAICLRFGRRGGQESIIGRLDGEDVLARGKCLEPAMEEEVMERTLDIVERWSRTSEGASPGVVVSRSKPPPGLYWSAVRRILARHEVEEALNRCKARYDGLADSRGIIGAAAAMSWRPRDRTYELLSYRERGRWGTERYLDKGSVIDMDRRFPTTFNNYDVEEDKVAIAPSSPCPILFGIRGEDPVQLLEANDTPISETSAGHLVFLTNQGTDDHIISNWRTLEPNSSYSITGKVIQEPRALEGGHVVLAMESGGNEIELTAYEPSKGFREVIRDLIVGDRIRVMGELRESPRTLNVEKLQVIDTEERFHKVSNPLCPSCGKSMKSVGRGKGYRCRRCGTKASDKDAAIVRQNRSLIPGWYQPPVSARRHLSKPLERMGKPPTSFKVE